MLDFSANSDVRSSSDRSFGIVFALFFTLVALFPLRDGGSPRSWAFVVGGAFLLVALVRPGVLRPFNRIWLRLGLFLGAVMSPVVMTLIFLLTVVPSGLVVRALKKDLISVEIDRNAATYWIDRTDGTQPVRSMKDQF